ncbi:unnamed protein product [Pleuronectes platessa]|uniref:ZP domain-containing protein n=2 Tax=Pleuronectes platessa TaxID=8262 RepID=A0A9N7UPX0_PLEPL|nr:unnamed protein product [Pleuronectes platessa]
MALFWQGVLLAILVAAIHEVDCRPDYVTLVWRENRNPVDPRTFVSVTGNQLIHSNDLMHISSPDSHELSFTHQVVCSYERGFSGPAESTSFPLGSFIPIMASVELQSHQPLLLLLDECVAAATPELNPGSDLYPIITNKGCLVDSKTSRSKFEPRQKTSEIQLSLQAFKFAIGKEVYLHCQLVAWDPVGLDHTKKACNYIKITDLMPLKMYPFNLNKAPIIYHSNKGCHSARQSVVRAEQGAELNQLNILCEQVAGFKMDWFHCNQCFTRKGSSFAVSSCGHISCEACIKSKQCSVCGASCSYLPITDEMKPQEKVFFKDPTKLIQSRLQHISQIVHFQWTQMERVTTHFKHKSVELERRLKEVSEQGYRQLTELKRENAALKKQLSELKRETAELKKPLSQRRVSPGQFHTDGTQRMTLPVAVTSPVTPRSRANSHFGSAESQGWTRGRGPSLSSLTTPGSATSISSNSSLHEHVHRTPTSFSTSTRTLHQTPVFQFQFMNGFSLQSPRR